MTGETISAALEDYLEAIFHIVVENQVARAKEIASRLSVHRSTVTAALKALSARKLINYAPYDAVTLTREGTSFAKDVIRRHEALRDFFVNVLAVKEATASEAACKMEHAMPGEIVDRLLQFSEFLEVCPRGGSKWIRGFQHYCDEALAKRDCERCIGLCLEDARKAKRTEEKSGGLVTLRDLNPGQKGKILSVKGERGWRKRIVEMGVIPGVLIAVERVAPLGDPIDVKVKGYHLSLRKEEAAGIAIEVC